MVSSAICGATGSAQVICNGGVPPYSFEWNNGILTANNNNLTPGTYFVTVTDHNGCTITNSAIVGFTPGTGSASVDTFANVSCNGLADGLLEVGMNFGIPPYTYNWQHDATNNTPEANNLSAGTYYVTINDNYGCSASFTYTISQPTVLTATHNVNNATCGPTGSISVSPSGGTSPFIGVWNTTDTTLNLTQLSAGFYSVTVIDAHLCTTTIDNIEIIDGGGSGSAEISNLDSISCHGSQDGSITVSMPLGFLPITYNWLHDPSLNSATASNLQPGQYVVTLTDSYGCTAIVNATMTEPAILGGIFVAHQTLCHGTPSGSIELSVSGGTPQYSYAWSNGVTIEDLTDVPTGFYSITVTDAHGCTWNANDIYVRDAPAMTVIQDITNITCNGDGNGSIALTILGGNEPYQVAWSNGNSGLSITGLDVGTYVSTVTDDNNCVISDTATLFQPLAINGTLATISPECHNSPNGSVYVSEISGGLPPYAYEWNNSIVTDSLLSHIMPGSYTITITDSLGCAYTMTAIVQNSDNICLVIPDVFTPNGDQINETFEILGIEAFMEAEMQIYNRWGDMLFKSTYYNEFWDGTWKGEPVPMGAYVFILDLKNGEPPIQGVVTVVY
jgi:gliding motility-associated-like protein